MKVFKKNLKSLNKNYICLLFKYCINFITVFTVVKLLVILNLLYFSFIILILLLKKLGKNTIIQIKYL